ncbi:glycine betaine ABC transporter substrate-binding protein [Clostridium polynesiense]|uniref:ABC transporter permease/substrate-binding protein n=1 Tax=Clostridium polynesiense TaxID=1325933 RepID=UPI0005903A91|nr:glycine betaine ABC transporter substrate-binding protein [Clostridium polynesiense]
MNFASALNTFWNFVLSRKEEIIKLIVEHIELTFLAVLFSLLIGIPLGILITRIKKLATPVLSIASIIQAVPSMALLGFLIPVLGIGSKPAIAMVFLYSLLPIVKNTYTGLMNINPDTLEAAQAIGLTKGQILKMIQIPLALPVIMTGIRISAVTAVGLMTIAAFIGAGGLGYMVFSGVQTVNNNMILAGAIPSCILALLMDYVIGKIETIVTPKGIKTADGKIKVGKDDKVPFKKGPAGKVIVTVLAIVLLSTSVSVYSKKGSTIVVASKNYNEQLILGNMMATLLEENTNLNIERRMNLGGSSVTFNAAKAKEVDIYAEYTGVALVNIMKHQAVSDPQETYDIVKDHFEKNYGITWLEPFGFNNTYTLAVKKDLASKYDLKTFSDLTKISSGLTLACTMEFVNREDGYVGLKNQYNMLFNDVKSIDGGLRYSSIDNNQADVIDAFSTDGLLKAFDLKVLEDDKKLFPPYYAVPIVRQEVIDKHPEIKTELNKLANTINEETMIELNYKVDKLGMDPRKVADDFLKEKGLI